MSKKFLAAGCVMLAVIHSVHGVSLSGKSSDDAVCDLSPNTLSRLSKKTFVEAGTRNEAEIYTRLALRFITSECRNSQTLILHSRTGSALDDEVFRAVTSNLCSPGSPKRSSTATRDNSYSFQVTCPIVKWQGAKSDYALREQAIPTERMIAEGAPRDFASDGSPDTKPKDCNKKLTTAAVIYGFGGTCPD